MVWLGNEGELESLTSSIFSSSEPMTLNLLKHDFYNRNNGAPDKFGKICPKCRETIKKT